jgi:PAS domain-containing protein
MYRLKIISGPNTGASFNLREGENPIGREEGNAIVLPSSKVSKQHCVLVVDNTRVVLRDEGSANGTFVNGALAREKRLKLGDRISVGKFILELRLARAPGADAPLPFASDNVGMPALANSPGAGGAIDAYRPGAFQSSAVAADAGAPQDLKGKVFQAVEQYVMPPFYGMIMKYEWNMIIAAIFVVFTVLNVIISVEPLLTANHISVVKESKRRALFMARLIAESNATLLAARNESKADIGITANAEGVRLAVLTDLENRVIAPVTKAGQYLVAGSEARAAKRAVELFKKGRETGIAEELDESTVVAIEPVKIFSPQFARNVTVGMAIVSIDVSLSTLSAGEASEVYSSALIYSALLCAVVVYIVYRLTLRPFNQLSEDLDKVLKGDMAQVTREYRLEEMKDLWDLIYVAVQRIPKDGGSAQGEGGGGPGAEDYIGPMRTLGSAGNIGVALFNPEKRIVYLNEIFEEMSGIRAADATGQEISAVARDQSIGQIFNELFDRVSAGGEGATEEAELSPGILFRIHVAAFGKSGELVRCYVATVVKSA